MFISTSCKDCLVGMQELADNSIDICITSPPYNLNISYGSYNDNLPRDRYLVWLSSVFKELTRVIKDDGHFWLNVGYSNVDPWIAMDVANVARDHFILQNNIAWVKSIYVANKTSGHFKPINSTRFISPTWENLFHFTKTGAAKLNRLAVGVPYEYYNSNLRNGKTQETKPNLRCRGNSWFVPYDTISNTKKERGGHPATFPVSLVRQALQISDITEGTVLDPFMGTGTSAIAAINLGLSYIGFDIDSNYVEFANSRIAAAVT